MSHGVTMHADAGIILASWDNFRSRDYVVGA